MKKLFSFALAALLILAFIPLGAYAEDIPRSDCGYIAYLSENGAAALADDPSFCHGFYYAENEAELRALISAGLCESYEIDHEVRLMGRVNDEYYDSRQWNLRSIGMETAWETGNRGSGVRVAAIDTGIYRENDDLINISVADGFSAFGDGTMDTVGHGTMVSGIIAAESDNSKGIAGICDEVTIVPIKCFRSKEVATVSDISRGIYAAVDDWSCDIICMSLGSDEPSFMLEQAVNYAVASGAIIIAAVGNDGSGTLYYPAAYDCVVGVGSYGRDGSFSSFSQHNASVFVSAPGEDIVSTFINSHDGYALGNGTSFAAPHVAALAAMAKHAEPELDAEGFKQLIIETSVDAGASGYDEYYGYGRLNAAGIVAALKERSNKPIEPTEPTEPFEPTEPQEPDVTPDPLIGFTDVAGHWAETYISYCVENSLFDGVSDTLFAPENTMTRAMVVTVLYRMSGETWAGGEAVFTDVADAALWYYAAVGWAAERGVVLGYDTGEFRPDSFVTREQLAAILYRYAGSPEVADFSVISAFADAGSVSEYAVPAMCWCCFGGIITGTDSGLSPSGNATRAQVATMLTRFMFQNENSPVL